MEHHKTEPLGLLQGAREIALFIYGKDDRKSIRRVHHLVATKQIPVTKVGKSLTASPQQLRSRFAPTFDAREGTGS